jgi:hypothetical protein
VGRIHSLLVSGRRRRPFVGTSAAGLYVLPSLIQSALSYWSDYHCCVVPAG